MSVICTFRGIDEIDSAIDRLDDTKVQLLFSKFPVGTGTFKRNKFIYVEFIGPKCGVVKRGRAINIISSFTAQNLHGIPGFSTTDKASLSFESLVDQMKYVFVTDNGTFSMEQIRSEYRNRLVEECKMMHRENKQAAAVAALKAATAAKKKSQVTVPPRAPTVNSGAVVKPPQSNVIPKTEAEWSARAKHVMESLRADNGPINWAVCEADTTAPRILSYGTNGIFELVKNLPDDKWLFGLFRISFVIAGERQRRIIFFQWIGSQLKPVRNDNTASIYPGMVKLLSPFAYEIYLVGKNDLNPQQIINKCKCAFRPKKDAKSGKASPMPVVDFTEAAYKAALEQEQEEMKQAPAVTEVETAQRPHKEKMISMVMDGMEQSLASISILGITQAGNYDIEETIKLVQSQEGGLVWAVFQVVD